MKWGKLGKSNPIQKGQIRYRNKFNFFILGLVNKPTKEALFKALLAAMVKGIFEGKCMFFVLGIESFDQIALIMVIILDLMWGK